MADARQLFAALAPQVRWNLSVRELAATVVANGEGERTRDGALAVSTGRYTGRSPLDKFTVRRPPSEAQIDWGSRFNQPFDPERAEALAARMLAHARGRRLYGFRGWVGRGDAALAIAVITEYAWHSLMARHMFVAPSAGEPHPDPEFVLLYLPSFRADPARDGTRSETIILCDLEQRYGLIGGTEYGGEQKKFFFYLLNYLLPQSRILPMHCSANVGRDGDVTILFGLSGTGKTTLSADSERRLLGDDEHGWDEHGIFNFEGGCYAKLIRLSRTGEPLIWAAVHRPGAILENVPVRDGVPDFADDRIENTRGVYPLDFLPNIVASGRAGHPSVMVYLTFDASGTLPPVSLLERDQALYWFLAGYTARVAGTERGLGRKPEPTFSACLAAPFLPLHPRVYLDLLRERLDRYRPTVVLLNTGSLGGPYGAGGERPPIEATRRMLAGAQSGALAGVACDRHPDFGVLIPRECPGVPPHLLEPRRGYVGGEAAYRAQVRELVAAFRARVNEVYAGSVPASILAAGPA